MKLPQDAPKHLLSHVGPSYFSKLKYEIICHYYQTMVTQLQIPTILFMFRISIEEHVTFSHHKHIYSL